MRVLLRLAIPRDVIHHAGPVPAVIRIIKLPSRVQQVALRNLARLPRPRQVAARRDGEVAANSIGVRQRAAIVRIRPAASGSVAVRRTRRPRDIHRLRLIRPRLSRLQLYQRLERRSSPRAGPDVPRRFAAGHGERQEVRRWGAVRAGVASRCRSCCGETS